jgi:hypothetical protein
MHFLIKILLVTDADEQIKLSTLTKNIYWIEVLIYQINK